MVLRDTDQPVAFLPESPAGWFKDRNPTVDPSQLTDQWVASSRCVYIGKANRLRQRIQQYIDFGRGQPVGHWGGRLIWQLADHTDLDIMWKPVEGVAAEVESAMLAQFEHLHGRLPFAYLRH